MFARFRIYAIPAILIAIASLYWLCLPTSVQGLDSAEIVGGSFAWRVLHPPGYPLIEFLFGGFTHALPWGSVFWRAAYLNSFFALGVILLLSRAMRGTGWLAIVLPLSLATCEVFWRYAVTPDVFMLNALFVGAIFYAYYFTRPSTRRSAVLTGLFALGATNHLTIVFTLPLLLEDAWTRKRWVLSFAMWSAGALLTVSFYLSLFDFHAGALESWGYLRTPGDLLAHFLRKDFGTFQLSGHAISSDLADHLLLFLAVGVRGFFAALLILALGLFHLIRDKVPARALWAGAACLLFYLTLFLMRANVSSFAVLERFFIMPLVICGFWSAAVIAQGVGPSARVRGWIAWLALAMTLVNLVSQFPQLDYRSRTVIEDYARNLLIETTKGSSGKIAMIIGDGDTRIGALRYLQLVERLAPNTIVLPAGLAFAPEVIAKIQMRDPRFHVSSSADGKSIFERIVKPNIDRYDFYLTDGKPRRGFETTYLGVGERISKGDGVHFDADSYAKTVRRPDIVVEAPSLEPSETKAIYAEYAYYDLRRGLEESDSAKAEASFVAALDKVPYCIPALANICLLEEKRGENAHGCRSKLRRLEAGEFNYYR